MSSTLPVRVGLYRHFKGEYYFVKEVVSDCGTNEMYCVYFNVCHPEKGTFIRSLSDFIADWDENKKIAIKDRKDNITGQRRRFDRVHDLTFRLSDVETSTLIEELDRREKA